MQTWLYFRFILVIGIVVACATGSVITSCARKPYPNGFPETRLQLPVGASVYKTKHTASGAGISFTAQQQPDEMRDYITTNLLALGYTQDPWIKYELNHSLSFHDDSKNISIVWSIDEIASTSNEQNHRYTLLFVQH